MASSEPQRETLIASLRQRYANAVRDDNAQAKQALFKEAVYLGIQPELFSEKPRWKTRGRCPSKSDRSSFRCWPGS
jgi:hypothetical protein